MDKQSLLLKLNVADLTDVEVFKSILQNSEETLILPDHEIANEFEVTPSTVKRWRNGVASPSPQLRKQILLFLKDKCS